MVRALTPPRQAADRRRRIAAARLRRARQGVRPKSHKKTTLPQRSLDRYQGFCYSILGERFDRDRADGRLDARVKQADYDVSPGLWRAMHLVTVTVAFVGGALVVLPGMVLLFSDTGSMLWGLVVVAAMTVATAVAFPATLAARIGNRRNKIEKELPFSLSELAVLASVGMSPIQLMRHMAGREHDAAVTGEFRKVMHKASMQGKDLVTALGETARESASPLLREAFWDLGNMIHQGGDLGEYLQARSADVLRSKREDQKSFIDELGTFADMYITLVLISTIFLSIGAFLMDAFGMSAGGLDADAMLQVLTYGFIPIVVTIVAVLLGSAHTSKG